MSQITYRANLSAKAFPFLSENWGRTVIVPQYDNTFSRQLTSQEDPDKDVGLPQIFYCHNVMPHSQGFQSVGYETALTDTHVGNDELLDIHYIQETTSSNQVYIAQAVNNDLWAWENTGPWFKIDNTNNGKVTIAQVNGITYIFANPFCWTYNFGTHALVPVVLGGLVMANIQGIVGAAGYMIAYDFTNVVYWSSAISPIDFVPSLVTGAGSISIEAAKGRIVSCEPHNFGFFIYTRGNIVAGLYSGNPRYPFNFREIVGSAGVQDSDFIAQDANTANHYAYTDAGLQMVSSSQTQTVAPELTDFISGYKWEDYDETTDTFSSIVITQSMVKRLAVVENRYLVISYGIVDEFSHAVIYDLINNRWGKLKISHQVCFEYHFVAGGFTDLARRGIAFLQKNGSVKVVTFSQNSTASDGVIMLGKYQFIRPRLLQLDEVNVENVQVGGNFSAYDLVALDGKNGVRSDLALLDSNGTYRRYGSRAIGINHSLVFKGAFFFTSLVLTFNIHGKR